MRESSNLKPPVAQCLLPPYCRPWLSQMAFTIPNGRVHEAQLAALYCKSRSQSYTRRLHGSLYSIVQAVQVIVHSSPVWITYLQAASFIAKPACSLAHGGYVYMVWRYMGSCCKTCPFQQPDTVDVLQYCWKFWPSPSNCMGFWPSHAASLLEYTLAYKS